MCDDAEFALETPICCLLQIPHMHAPLEPSVKSSFIRFGKVGASYKDIHRLHCAGALRETRVCLMYIWSVWPRQSVFSLQMLYRVIMHVVWNAVDLIFKIWTSLTEGCFDFKCWCALDCVDCSRMRLCTTPCKWFNVLVVQNGFMTQNLCKHGQLCLRGLNGQDKPHNFYFNRDPCVDAA